MDTERNKAKLVEFKIIITYADGKKLEWTTTPGNIIELLKDERVVKMIIKKRDD